MHLHGIDRQAPASLPALLDDWIETDHIVRVIDNWVDKLDLAAPGLARAKAGTVYF